MRLAHVGFLLKGLRVGYILIFTMTRSVGGYMFSM